MSWFHMINMANAGPYIGQNIYKAPYYGVLNYASFNLGAMANKYAEKSAPGSPKVKMFLGGLAEGLIIGVGDVAKDYVRSQ